MTGLPVNLPEQKETGNMAIMDAHQTQAAAEVWNCGQPVTEPYGPILTKTIYPFPSEVPGKFLTKVRGGEKRSGMASPALGAFSCCCCDIAIGEIVCQVRDTDDCMCNMVMCPENAKTTTVTAPAPTVI
ncbi:hypothetical protein E4U42_006428 [Claviceps africana]|uniref:Uncharacterized protein n=1 Tax=Claviceps africana TaxID=83212 RepID=A0A8K0NF01_9HYPO|nr:hypothetical protein E4U42_006428 [Claviceps africana]